MNINSLGPLLQTLNYRAPQDSWEDSTHAVHYAWHFSSHCSHSVEPERNTEAPPRGFSIHLSYKLPSLSLQLYSYIKFGVEKVKHNCLMS